MKKKTLAMALSCALIAVVGIGSTFAYFTDNEKTENRVKMGKIDIVLDESEDGDKFVSTGLEYSDKLPGDIVEKIARVSLAEGSSNAYVRVKASFSYEWEAKEIEQPTLFLNDEEVSVDEDGYLWINNTNTFCLEQGDEPLIVFDSVEIPTSWNNEAMEGTFTIDLSAEAVQMANVEHEDAWEAYVDSQPEE